MSTDMLGIHQTSLFSLTAGVSVTVGTDSQYRILSQVMPWPEAAEIVNRYRAMKIDIDNGRILNLRARYHAGVRLLCGLEGTTTTMDRTRIEAFRNCVGLPNLILRQKTGLILTTTL
ncbi:MAG: hypothetical protein A2Z20_01655 [Bdellovibrionales bacterium RBG_16_40_8]|nr:MAG: hypothetical protein A2Z20_01655 [Bdellovibrionales bacterium RBG_16_40_8]